MSTGPVDTVTSPQAYPAGAVAAVARTIAPGRAAGQAEDRAEPPAATNAPNLGPYRIGAGAGYQLVVYSEPLLRTGIEPAIANRGQVFDTHA